MVFNHLIGVRFPVGPPKYYYFTMKFLRVGDINNEKPAVLDDKGQARDLSSIILDLDPSTINKNTIKKIEEKKINNLPLVKNPFRIGPCISKPQKFIGVGLNYSDHAAETGMATPKEPIIFMKATSCLSGPNDDVKIPKKSKKTDWEVELGIIIGEKAQYISEAVSQKHIFGYCIVNDVSEREFQIDRGGTWDKGKSCDTFGPVGPYLVTKDEIKDIKNLNLELKLNGNVMQKGNTNKMIFDVNYLVSYISNFMTLLPGDIITTGTPPGVGMARKPQIFLKAGDEMNLSIDFLGSQKQKVSNLS